MEELLFYTVDRNYIRYLSEFESHISYNKDEIGHSRPYLGIIILVFSLYMIEKIIHWQLLNFQL